MTQPIVFRNDWSSLTPPALGEWEPTLSVSVVIPAYDAQRLLPTVLAGLAAQTYPAHLLEVVIANDSPDPLELPDLRPERTRVVEVADGWGRAAACHAGALAADGDVLHWLDADMLLAPQHVEAQLRWHHLIDYAVVLGHKWFIDPAPVLALTPVEVGARVGASASPWGPESAQLPHDWIEKVYDRTADLQQAGPHALRTHVGATASLHRSLYDRAGGMDTSLKLGEDIDLGYRLAEAGAVFIPDRAARSWHLGASHVMEQAELVNAYNDGFLADRVPDLRAKRRPGRTYAVPYLEVVLDTTGSASAEVVTVVDAVLASALPDLVVTLVGSWAELADDVRRSPLTEPLVDPRIVAAHYASEPRVRLVETLAADSDAMLRLVLPDASLAPRRKTLGDLCLDLDQTHDGERVLRYPDGSEAVLQRLAGVRRAAHLGSTLAEVYGSAEVSALDVGFVATDEHPHPHQPRTGGPPSASEVISTSSINENQPTSPVEPVETTERRKPRWRRD